MQFTSLLSTVACLFLLLVVGFIGGKTKIIDEQSTKKFSSLIVKVGQPFLIINSIISQKCTRENLKTGLMILVLGLIMHSVMATLAYFLAKPYKRIDKRALGEYSMFFANCGFMGFPIIESLGIENGLFYGAFYVMSFHLFVWTYGLVILGRANKDIKINVKNILLNYGTVPCVIGFVIFVSRLPLPDFVLSMSNYLAGLCTPISMLIAGANIARRSLKHMFLDPKIYYTSAVKLVLMPLVAATVLWAVGLPDYVVIFGTVMAAMPSASILASFGEMYDIVPGFASELVGTSTIFSVATIVPTVSYATWLVSLR